MLTRTAGIADITVVVEETTLRTESYAPQALQHHGYRMGRRCRV
jgi:hypothetical protein